MLLARKEDNLKKQQALERIQRSEELYLERVSRLDKKMEDREIKFKEMKKKQEEELKAKAAMQWLRVKMGDINAQRIERRNQYNRERTLSAMEQKTKISEEYKKQQQEENEKRLKHSQLIQKKRTKLVNEFNDMLNLGNEPDISALAEKFGIDIESVRERYAIKRRGQSSLSQLTTKESEEER